MSFAKPTPEKLAELKAKHGNILVVEFGELGYFVLQCMTKETYSDYVDAAMRDRQNANQRYAARSVLAPLASEYAVVRMRKPGLAGTIVGLLLEAAGIPRGENTQADTWAERLSDKTPPASLERAGLSAEKAQELLMLGERELTLVSVSDRSGVVFFGGVLAAPTDVESGMIHDLKKLKKGVQNGLLSVVESCLPWSREPLSQTVDSHPAIVSVLMEVLQDAFEVADTALFRP